MSRLLPIVLVVLITWVTSSQTQNTTTFNNTTHGNGRVGWVSPDSRRSTWGIIWSCFAVFLICSWKCTPLNIPALEETEAGWREWHGVRYWPEWPLLRKWLRKLGWMMLVFIAPELVVATAASQYMAAKKSMNKLRGVWTDKIIYSLTHAFYANMGGFVVAVPKDEAIVRLKGEFQRHGNPVADFRALQAVFRNKELDYFRVSLPIFLLRNLGLVFDIDEVDITDKSKADTFTKVFAIFQYGALVIQSIARLASGLSITELELMTMAFVLSALFTYILLVG
ncbi:hypothetical protein L207DRAFT_639777 [Hyaloscypha variabilis F]|uniref:Uncharacterized protein n=1 Tax=Hyaloscypha variabilis (strain UAMH 11265 / GT02V1 / F) TaxID=1149755 RepID=A0A2J6R3F6_HYAVF|nr:hypothetical protein L207DRAFT_639777 [Hyaloscypha variabilis F]